MWRALLWLEVRQQAREPLTALYALVFFLLSLGYTLSGAVELVGDRGTVPKHAPWALALAYGGLTAFGQVITTMVVATAMLRDSATRIVALIVATRLSPRRWFTARLGAALLVLSAVYIAMPAGAWIGSLIGSLLAQQRASPLATDAVIATGAPVATDVAAYLLPFLVITAPTCLVVSALLGSAAALTQRVMWVLAVALALVGVWQLALALEAQEATRTIGALLDPFANAPVLADTRGWSVAQRSAASVPLGGLLLWNRLLWVALSVGIAALTAWRLRWPTIAVAPRNARVMPATGAISAHALASRRAGHTSAFTELARFTASWMLRDGGWRVVMGLAVLNATMNAWARSSAQSSATDVLALVAEHSRLFLILLATVYAGEVLWREREIRVDALYDSTSVRTSTLAIGRLAGLFLAQLPVVLLLGACAAAIALVRGGNGANSLHGSQWLAWLLFVIWLPFAQLTALSVAVHVVVRHKVMAHLLLITGWVVAVTLDRQGANAWWYRFAEPAPLMQLDANGADQVAWLALASRAAWWTLISLPLLWLTIVRWPRGSPQARARWRDS